MSVCFYLIPELIVFKVHIGTKIRVGFAVFQHFTGWESNGAVTDVIIFDEGSGCFVRCGIGDVFKVFQCDVRSAEKIKEVSGRFLCGAHFWG